MSEIFTYGNGEMLKCVFDSIAMIMNGGNHQFYKPLLRIGALVGATWAISKALWDSDIQGLVLHWLIPMVALVGICIIPSMSVNINDVLRPLEETRIDNVPLGLARAAQTISAIGYAVTKTVEIAFHTPDHGLYNKTGMIFGAENFLEMNRFAITDEHLADTMRDFVHNCVTYDLAMELYSINDLKAAPNIWKLIAENTSNIRMFSFCTEKGTASEDGKTAPQSKKDRCVLKSCHDGAGDLANLLAAYKKKFEKAHIFQHMPHFYQQLTGMAQDAQVLISQQIMMHSIIDAVERKCESSGIGTNFAIRRAYLQQRNTYEVVGGLAAKSLVVMRNIMEAIIYAAFIFIMPFALIPMGFKVFLKWLWLLVWIQLWPPFYAILNSGIMIIAKQQSKLIPGIEGGLTLMSSTGLHNLALDMQAYAAYASLSIPFLSYALLQGGISVLAQVAGSITSVSQGAGSAAAQDLTTGNYNYGNVQLENLSHGNQSMLQRNFAPSLSTGHFKENNGDSETTYGEKNVFINERVSQLPFKIRVSESASQRLSNSETQSLEMANRTASSFSETSSQIGQEATSLAEHISQNKAFNHTVSADKQHAVSQAGHEMMTKAAEWGKAHNMSTQASCQFLVQATGATPGKNGIGATLSASSMGTDEKTWQEAQNFVKSSGFDKNYQTLQTVTDGSSISTHDEVGTTITKNLTHLQEQSTQQQKSYEEHMQRANTYAQARETIKSKAVDIDRDKTQDFVNDLSTEKDQTGQPRGFQKTRALLESPAAYEPRLQRYTNEETDKLIANVMSSNTPSHTVPPINNGHPQHMQNSNYRIQRSSPDAISNTDTTFSTGFRQPPSSMNMDFDAARNGIEKKITREESRIFGKQDHIETQVNNHLDQSKANLKKDMRTSVQDEQNTSSLTRMFKGLPGGSTVLEFFSLTEAVKSHRQKKQKMELNKAIEIDPKEQARTDFNKEFYAGTQYEDDYKDPDRTVLSESNMKSNLNKK